MKIIVKMTKQKRGEYKIKEEHIEKLNKFVKKVEIKLKKQDDSKYKCWGNS